MMKEKYYCYICGNEITDANRTDEHVILNSIGGHLHSYTIICKNCNNKMGEAADAKLAEDLSFYTDFLGVKKNRQHDHNQVMTPDKIAVIQRDIMEYFEKKIERSFDLKEGKKR